MPAELEMRDEAVPVASVPPPRSRRSVSSGLRGVSWHSVRRLGWGVADQGMSSLTNFAVTVTVARTLGAENFGAFTLAFVTYSFALNAAKGLASDPMIVRYNGVDEPTWRRAVAQASGTALTVGVVLSVVMVAIATLLDGSAQGAFLALGLTLPGLLLQDSWRYALFAAGRGRQAFLNDLVWGLSLVPTLFLAQVTGHTTAFWFVLAWGLAACVAAVFGMFQTGTVPRPERTLEWLRRHRDLGLRYMIEGTTSSVAGQLRVYGIGIMLGLAAVGYVQASATLMGPIMIIFFGTGTVIVPELGRVIRRAPHRLPAACLAFGSVLAVAALLWGLLLLAALPAGLGELLLGDVWGPTYPLVLLATLSVMGGSVQAGAGAGMRALGAARRSLRSMIASSAVLVVFALSGAALNGVYGVMQAGVAASWIGAAIWWWQLRQEMRSFVPVTGPAPEESTADADRGVERAEALPVVVATVPREHGITGVHTHVRQFRRFLQQQGEPEELITPYAWGATPAGWGRVVIGPAFALRLLLERVNGPANVRWYRGSHEFFLRRALRRRLASGAACVVYAQCPVSARAALRARRGPQQRVVLAVHFRISQADEWADKGQIGRDGKTFRSIRSLERDVVQQVDGLVFVSAWARRALVEWLPEAAAVPSAVIDNFVSPYASATAPGSIGDLVTVGNLEAIKNHRYLLDVLAAARDAGRRYTLDVYGEGVEHRNLQRRAEALGLTDQVRLLGFRTDVRDRLPGYRVYVHASYSESSSLAIIESMAAGLPVVAGDTGPLTELFDDGVEGRFWPLDDAERAASILAGLIESETESSRASEAVRVRFSEDYDATVIAPRLLSFVRGTASASVTGRGRLAASTGGETIR